MRIDLTRQQVGAVLAMLADAGQDDDEQLVADTLEGETDLFELVARLLEYNEADEGQIAALGDQIDARKARKERAQKRVQSRREAIAALMECARQDKLTLPEATLSLRKIAPKLIVTDPDALPDEYVTIVRKPDLSAIRAATCAVPGTAQDNGGTSLTVRRR